MSCCCCPLLVLADVLPVRWHDCTNARSDGFEKGFSDDLNCWVYVGAVKTGGDLFHPSCQKLNAGGGGPTAS